ncbi:pyridoxal phosphate-dependent aminotransferase [Rhodococcus sp. T7]|uniref:pyridoxal phosphate-dependent aminotransferase n=1 Tax=Rhodococcus sp. T7 TaxID=627444 RepID=UPI00135948E2|nr:pyridoxal phosphate-dependent aminotransferase [Rhodococcus sp. T7]KAF0957330.1 Glutamate-pyruvate aminotransferase AlaC [Rhodococcus sp. T7]KAF0959177.1 Glutamate-pyruvate aminotransferase AlaC [Rhodococcus sp. T7]
MTAGPAPGTQATDGELILLERERLRALADRSGWEPLLLSEARGLLGPPPQLVAALRDTDSWDWGYPREQPAPATTDAIRAWFAGVYGVQLAPEEIGISLGATEIIRSAAAYLRPLRPDMGTVLVPAPTFHHFAGGAESDGLQVVRIPRGPDGQLDLNQVADRDRADTLLMWLCSPSNPDGYLMDLSAAVQFTNTHGIFLLVDETYAPFCWNGPPRTVLSGHRRRLLALHTLSKLANVPSLRAGFFVGDPELVAQVGRLRDRRGLIVPEPVERALRAAVSTTSWVESARSTVEEPMHRTVAALRQAGLSARIPEGGLYIWACLDGYSDRTLADALALQAGIVCLPGQHFKEPAPLHVRIAATLTDGQIDELPARLIRLIQPS